MTSRSERRDREMRVIDAAVRYRVEFERAQRMSSGNGAYIAARAQMFMAIDEYSKHELAEPSATRTNLLSPETAHEAEGFAKRFALTDAGEVFRQIYYAWRRGVRRDPTWDDNGLTTDEVEAALERTHQSISARVNALKNAGWIIATEEKRKTRSGGQAQVYTPTQAAIAFVNAHGLPIPVSPHPRPLIEVLNEEGTE